MRTNIAIASFSVVTDVVDLTGLPVISAKTAFHSGLLAARMWDVPDANSFHTAA